MDSLDSVKESTSPAGRSAKPLIMSQNSGPTRRGGFQVDSPVRNPVASEIARSAPPYTDRAREEPREGVCVQKAPCSLIPWSSFVRNCLSEDVFTMPAQIRGVWAIAPVCRLKQLAVGTKKSIHNLGWYLVS